MYIRVFKGSESGVKRTVVSVARLLGPVLHTSLSLPFHSFSIRLITLIESIHLDVLVDILRTDHSIEEDVSQHGD